MAKDPVLDVLYRVKRGLSGYVSYLAACEMNESFSEYILYEPTLRILTARGYSVRCEYPCPGFPKQGPGDFKKLDFVASGNGATFAIEIKWARSSRLNVGSDVQKLCNFRMAHNAARGFLLVFGRKSAIQELSFTAQRLHEIGNPVYAEFGVTRYGCRNYEATAG